MELHVVRRNGDRHTIIYDDADHALLCKHRWYVWQAPLGRGDLYYARTNLYVNDRRTNIAMHTLLTTSRDVDHKNLNGLDNRRANLRLATRSQQGANQRDHGGSSSYKGVSWSRGRNKWEAKIRVDQVSKFLGRFEVEQDAAAAYDHAARAAWGEFALTNEALGGQA